MIAKEKRRKEEKRNMLKIKDIDRIILGKLEDKELFQILSLNKYLYKICDDSFFRNRLVGKYPHLVNNKENWKQYYMESMKYINMMKRRYNFTFTIYGTPKNHYEILEKIHYIHSGKVVLICNDLSKIFHECYTKDYKDLLLYECNTSRNILGAPPLTYDSPEFNLYVDMLQFM